MKVAIKIFISLISTFLLIELIFRTIIFFPSKDINVYKYGLVKSIKLSFEEVYPIRFTLKNNTGIIKEEETKNQKEKKAKFLVFGGSTTRGWIDKCKSPVLDSITSSWPDELKKINNNFDFYNFAENGANSDDQLKVLEKRIKTYEAEVILWASKFNMDNIFYWNDYPNYDLLKYSFSNTRKNYFFLMINSINNSISNYMASYKFLNLISLRIRQNYFNYNLYSQEMNISKEDVYYSVQNNKINTKKAIKIAQKYNIKKFYIVSLPYRNLRFDFEPYKFDLYDKAIIELEKEFEPFVKVIDVKNDPVYLNNEELFCDNVHQTPKGNSLQAEHIYNRLVKDKYLNE